jgi:isopenicillin-N N-acyltransferase like protein
VKERQEFKIIECAGSAYEIGRQYGMACKDSILHSIKGLIGGINYLQGVAPSDILATAAKYLPSAQGFDPELIEMLRGQAEGAGVTFEEVFALRCGTEMNFYYKRLTTLCTSFAVTARATKDGKTILGQTYDWSPGSSIDLVRTKQADGLEQLSVVISAGIGGEVWLNSAGLGMVLNVMVGPAREQEINVPFACLIPRAMRQKRIGDALGISCAHGRSILNYTFASGEGDIIGLETWPNDYNVLYPENDILVHTNHYLTERFKKGGGTMGFMEGDSHIRLQRLKGQIEQRFGELTPEIMMELLSDHTDYPRSICKHVADGVALGETIAAMIMVPEERAMYITKGHPCENEFIKYEL